ncbi:hypothetical protein H312_01592, partial [Anncaliia algerae PRA339]
HGRLEKCPSYTSDDFTGITWLVGIIDPQSADIRLEIVENRASMTMVELFKKYIHEGTTIMTDGFRSYPSAMASINGVHKIVNHSNGFKSLEGYHTNNIEFMVFIKI